MYMYKFSFRFYAFPASGDDDIFDDSTDYDTTDTSDSEDSEISDTTIVRRKTSQIRGMVFQIVARSSFAKILKLRSF